MSAPAARPADEELIETARRGGAPGRRAFSELVKRYQTKVVRLIIHLLSSSSSAEDVAQEAFVRAYLAINNYPTGVPFWPWIRKIATRLAYNHRRDHSTRKRYEDRVDGSSVVRQTVATRNALEQALSKLSYPYREILVLRYVEEMPIKDIAELLKIGQSAAKMRLSRARDDLKESYDDVTR